MAAIDVSSVCENFVFKYVSAAQTKNQKRLPIERHAARRSKQSNPDDETFRDGHHETVEQWTKSDVPVYSARKNAFADEVFATACRARGTSHTGVKNRREFRRIPVHDRTGRREREIDLIPAINPFARRKRFCAD